MMVEDVVVRDDEEGHVISMMTAPTRADGFSAGHVSSFGPRRGPKEGIRGHYGGVRRPKGEKVC